MNKDKKTLYAVSSLIFAVLLGALFVSVKNSKLLAAGLLLPLAIITRLIIKKRSSFSVNKKEVALLAAIIGTLYVVLLEMSGLAFGFFKNPYFVSPAPILSTVLPLAIIIVASELIRSTLLAQKDTAASVLAFLSCILADVLSFSTLAGITSFNRFMDLVGITLFPAISANAYYHFVSRRYGMIPNILFRLITTVYIYFLPSVTAMSDALRAFIKIFFPMIMLALVIALFEKRKKNALQKGKKLSVAATVAVAALSVAGMMLISCQFRFGALVIATESMTGEINKGDMIIYERYEDQPIKEGQVIVFQKNQNKIVHRVIQIERIEGEVRYITKGDANAEVDLGYVTEAEIVGLTDMKVAYVGFPTIWLRDLLEGSN